LRFSDVSYAITQPEITGLEYQKGCGCLYGEFD